jgi:hypothetical protein
MCNNLYEGEGRFMEELISKNIKRNIDGFYFELKIEPKSPYLSKVVKIFLGSKNEVEYDEDDLKEYEKTIKKLFENINGIIEDTKIAIYDKYKNNYSENYEKEFIVDDLFEQDENSKETFFPLNIPNKKVSFGYINKIENIRVLNGDKVELEVIYLLDANLHKFKINANINPEF